MSQNHLALMIRDSVKKFPGNVAMRYKDAGIWKEINYNEMGQKIQNLSKALLEINANPGDMIGIFSGNRPEWSIADFGILMIKAVSVPIYATNTAKQAEYIIDDANIKILFAGSQEQYAKALTFKEKLDKIIVFDEDIIPASANTIKLGEFLKSGAASSRDAEIDERLKDVSPDDLATLIYTSGTTGDPKGVMLTHGNFFHQIIGVTEHFDITTEDRSLCFLPLSHAYERAWSYVIFHTGAKNSYLSDTKKILEFMLEVRPTCMVSVPRLYEKIYSTVYARVSKASGLKKALFNGSISRGRKYQNKKKDKKFIGPWLRLTHFLADALVLKKLREVVGGPKNFFSAGGAPLSSDIEEFFLALGLLVCQGYGLTETAPVVTCNRPKDFKFGTVGKPLTGVELKIADDGEILVRGPNLMVGYYNKPEATAEAIVDGWFHTGDVGLIDEQGFLRITDRIKDLIITSQGKNVAPQHIEMLVGQDHYIEQIATIGDKRKYITALIVPSFLALEEYAEDNKISFSSKEDLLQKKEILDFYSKRIADRSRELANYERIKRFTLLPKEFTQDAGELTPTLKIKRKIIGEKYKTLIDAMYTDEKE